MDFKTNFSQVQYDAQKLEAATAKDFASRYKQASQDYLKQLCEIDTEALKQIRKILLNTISYEAAAFDVEQSVKPLLTNVSKTGNLPHHQINSIADLIDEGKINLFPFNQLTETARNEISELCEVTSLINVVSSKHSDTDLFDLFSAWEVAPLKGRMHKEFSFIPRE